jgi:hypothetical protein
MGKRQEIEIWTDQIPGGERAVLPAFGKRAVESVSVDFSVLSRNITELTAHFQALLDKQPKSPSGYYIDEIELSLGVNAKGAVALLGKLEAGVQSSIKVKIKRERP